MANIDWSFISRLEGGQRLTGYYTGANRRGKDGVTIATGVDLGQRNEYDLRKLGLSNSLHNKLKPYLGLKGHLAAQFLKNNPLKITKPEADQLDRAIKRVHIDPLIRRYNLDVGRLPGKLMFERLPRALQTIIVSPSWQHGNQLFRAAPKFWGYVTNQNWHGAYAELMNFRDDFPTRRRAEARYLKQWLDQQPGPR